MHKNNICFLDSFNTKVMSTDVLMVFRCINNSKISPTIMKKEKELLINSFVKDRFLFDNQYLYYKTVEIIIKIGLNIKDVEIIDRKTIVNGNKIIQDSFDSLLQIFALITNATNINDLLKMNLIDNVCSLYEELDLNHYNFAVSVMELNDKINNFCLSLQNNNNEENNEEIVTKSLTYSSNKSAC